MKSNTICDQSMWPLFASVGTSCDRLHIHEITKCGHTVWSLLPNMLTWWATFLYVWPFHQHWYVIIFLLGLLFNVNTLCACGHFMWPHHVTKWSTINLTLKLYYIITKSIKNASQINDTHNSVKEITKIKIEKAKTLKSTPQNSRLTAKKYLKRIHKMTIVAKK